MAVSKDCLASRHHPLPGIQAAYSRCEHAIEACRMGSRPEDQGRQTCNKVPRFEDDMSGAIAKAFTAARAFASLIGWTPLMGQGLMAGCFQLVSKITTRC